ncbi:hypothetical protein OJF2_54040 [Aquisphaera giovannonii]|uniref:Right handed beta helix domain-containing protein n=1 Tax=Aquisphaera giovannonii TaxID=406548 RepID=A0A5B9W9B4_9BACT|nr:hypothetical protein [Aquisphaera giovannonii]QEH36819.1 hypothetical protein OJF2_54040 [Aquisphaera giovannonii]
MRLFAVAVTVACSLIPAVVEAQSSPRQRSARAPSIRWIGQDGHDYVAPNNRREPSGVQDVHLVLEGLDPAREVTHVDVKAESPWNEWEYDRPNFSWKLELKRARGARSADLFLEPGDTEAARTYHFLVEDDAGNKWEFDVRGRKVDRGLRMPGLAMQAKWLGQDRHDRVASGPSVGPDGIQDARIRLSGISAKIAVKSIRIEGQGGTKWQSGTNPDLLPNAEFWADPKTTGAGDLHFQPTRDVKGQKLKVVVRYDNDTEDSATVLAGRLDPKLRMPETPLPRLTTAAAKAEWLGQDGQGPGGPGDVHVRLSGMPRPSSLAEAVLTDGVTSTWAFRQGPAGRVQDADGNVFAPLVVRPAADDSALDLFFAPDRDEAKAGFTFRFADTAGRMTVARFEGGACDPGRRAPRPAGTRATAQPGDDLNRLADQNGTLILSPGTYRLASPLVLENPVTIDGGGKATLVFAQGAGEPPWTAAIKIHAGNTTLNGFAVRFVGKVRWDGAVSYGPAVIGTTDNKDRPRGGPRVNISLTRLDLESPAAEDPSKWAEAIRLVRLTNAAGGMIAGNVLRGGTIEFFDGPWQILNNDFRGTPAGTISHGIFSAHGTHDLVVKGNRAKPVEPAGKTWRFLVLTHRGVRDIVEENTIEGLGARPDDAAPWVNDPEIVLTEAYHVAYEGRIQALSADGLVLRTHRRQGNPVGSGDAVSLLDGPSAGEFRRIAQVIDAETYLLEAPIPKGTDAVSVARGFVDTSFLKNRIAMSPGRRADGFTSDGLILPGNHFGTRVEGNHISGGGLAMKLAAYPSETPVAWGWSHAPFLGGVVDGNILEDAIAGARLTVDHSARYVKSNRGRVYMSIRLDNNVVRWTDAFLKWRSSSGEKTPLAGLVLGELPSHDPAELAVRASCNRLEAPPGPEAGASLVVDAAEYNGQKLHRRRYSLPAAPGAARSSATTAPRADSSARR